MAYSCRIGCEVYLVLVFLPPDSEYFLLSEVPGIFDPDDAELLNYLRHLRAILSTPPQDLIPDKPHITRGTNLIPINGSVF